MPLRNAIRHPGGIVLALLLALLAARPGSSAALGTPEPTGPAPARSTGGFRLPGELVVEPLGPLSLQVSWEGRPVLRVRLVWASSQDTDPAAAAAGDPPGPVPKVAPLPNRPTAAAGMEVIARAGWVVSARTRVRSEWYHWPYFQVDDLVVWNLAPRGVGASVLQVRWTPLAAPPIRIRSATPRVDLKPHGGPGRAQSIEICRWKLEDTQGRRRFLALLPLASTVAEPPTQDHGSIVQTLRAAEDEDTWVLALVTAPSAAAFLYNGGQALRMASPAVERPEIASKTFNHRAPRIELPPLCYNCRSARAEGCRSYLAQGGEDAVELSVEILGLRGHGHLDGEALQWGDHPLARWWRGDEGERAWYRIPRGGELAETLLEAAAKTEAVPLELPLDTGIRLSVETRLGADPALVETARRPRADVAPIPHKLAPELLEVWPNPFQETTTIRVRVPETLGEAYFFPEGAPEGLDLSAPPPFGDHPTLRIAIYNVGGKRVRELGERVAARGTIQVQWDGRDWMGRPVAAGAYYLDVEIGGEHLTRRILRLRS